MLRFVQMGSSAPAESGSDDSDSEVSGSDSTDSSDYDSGVEDLRDKVAADPNNYDAHTKLIASLKGATRRREAREAMAAVFPLSEDLWLSWITDEEHNKSSPLLIDSLFERAVSDYHCTLFLLTEG
jgi:hypothetical protein